MTVPFSALHLAILFWAAMALGTTFLRLVRSQSLLTPEAFIYLASTLMLYVVWYSLGGTRISSTLLILFHADLIGMMVLAQFGYSGLVTARYIPLILAVVGIVFEQAFCTYGSYHTYSPYALYSFLVLSNILLSIYSFLVLEPTGE